MKRGERFSVSEEKREEARGKVKGKAEEPRVRIPA
jgi:hypothetical protein